MKKLIATLLFIPLFSWTPAQIDDENMYNINEEQNEITDFGQIEEEFISEKLIKNGKGNYVIIDTREIKIKDLVNRTPDKLVIEREIGIVTARTTDENIFIGKVLNCKNEKYNGITYEDSCGLKIGTIVLTYLIFNPYSTGEDDILLRYDYVLDRSFEGK